LERNSINKKIKDEEEILYKQKQEIKENMSIKYRNKVIELNSQQSTEKNLFDNQNLVKRGSMNKLDNSNKRYSTPDIKRVSRIKLKGSFGNDKRPSNLNARNDFAQTAKFN